MKNEPKNGKPSMGNPAAVVCFCLAAVAALGIFSYNRSANELEKELSGIKGGTAQPSSENSFTGSYYHEEKANAADAPAKVPFEQAEAPAENIVMDADALSGENAEPAGIVNDNAEQAAAEVKFSGAVVRPVNGAILCDYSDGELMKSKTLNVWKTHDGIDVRADAGTPVKSMAEGRVEEIRSDPLMGITVVIDHGSGYEGWYCNLSPDLEVIEGEQVNAGTVIGEIGETAEAEILEEEHLHFGLKKNGEWTDPDDLLSVTGS